MSFWRFLDDFSVFLVILRPTKFQVLLKYLQCAVIASSVYLTKGFVRHECLYSYFEKSNKMCLKQPTLLALGPNISAHRLFSDMRFLAVNSKYTRVSHIYELGVLYDAGKHLPRLPRNFPYSDAVKCHPAPNIFPLAVCQSVNTDI